MKLTRDETRREGMPECVDSEVPDTTSLQMPLHITPAERAALQLLADGRAGHEIAGQLGASESDLEPRLAALFARMGVTGLRDAIAAAVRRGLVPPGS